MTMHVALAPDPAAQVRPSARVKTVAKLLDCDPGCIWDLIHDGEVETHGKGKRGIRVYLDSVRAYQDRENKPLPDGSPATIQAKKRTSVTSTAAFRTAMAGLQAKGLA